MGKGVANMYTFDLKMFIFDSNDEPFASKMSIFGSDDSTIASIMSIFDPNGSMFDSNVSGLIRMRKRLAQK
jgi:hypothetical protein